MKKVSAMKTLFIASALLCSIPLSAMQPISLKTIRELLNTKKLLEQRIAHLNAQLAQKTNDTDLKQWHDAQQELLTVNKQLEGLPPDRVALAG